MEQSFVRNETGMNEDDEEEDIAEDANDGDDGVDAAIEHFVYELVNLRGVSRNVHIHHHFCFDIITIDVLSRE